MIEHPSALDETTKRRNREQGRGRSADRPSEIPIRGWKDVLWRLWSQLSDDRILLIAAGTTFYMLLALFPALAAFVSVYGFVSDPKTIADQIAFLGEILPSGGFEVIQSQLEALAGQETSALGYGFLFGLGIALWSANNGMKTLFDAMNIAYEEKEKRSFIKLNFISFAFTLGAMLIGILFLVSVSVIPAVLAMLRLNDWTEFLIYVLRWPVMIVATAAAITLIYRFGPSREKARWRWLTWGSAIATFIWIAASVGFSFFLENFADYNATYGALGAAIGFMMWIWISVTILIVGAELNAELEHQTGQDSTIGAPLPIGERGAVMADTLGKSVGDD